MLVTALNELMQKAVDKADYINKDAENFIDFCNTFKNNQ